jgi:hypothetical protein
MKLFARVGIMALLAVWAIVGVAFAWQEGDDWWQWREPEGDLLLFSSINSKGTTVDKQLYPAVLTVESGVRASAAIPDFDNDPDQVIGSIEIPSPAAKYHIVNLLPIPAQEDWEASFFRPVKEAVGPGEARSFLVGIGSSTDIIPGTRDYVSYYIFPASKDETGRPWEIGFMGDVGAAFAGKTFSVNVPGYSNDPSSWTAPAFLTEKQLRDDYGLRVELVKSPGGEYLEALKLTSKSSIGLEVIHIGYIDTGSHMWRYDPANESVGRGTTWTIPITEIRPDNHYDMSGWGGVISLDERLQVNVEFGVNDAEYTWMFLQEQKPENISPPTDSNTSPERPQQASQPGRYKIGITTKNGIALPKGLAFRIWFQNQSAGSQNQSAGLRVAANESSYGPFIVESVEGALDIDMNNLENSNGERGSVPDGTYSVQYADMASNGTVYRGSTEAAAFSNSGGNGGGSDSSSSGCNAGLSLFGLLLAGLVTRTYRKA